VLADLDLRKEALSKFLGENVAKEAKFSPCSGGVNNFMDYVLLPSGNKYVLRIYNNGFDRERVDFEHRVLKEVSSKRQLSFMIPVPKPSLTDGKGHAILSNGAESSLFDFIPGELPKKTRARAIGSACGELCTAMEGITVDMVSPNARYFNIFDAHYAINEELFFEEIKKPEWGSYQNSRKYVDLLADEIRKMVTKLEAFKALNLPEQLIHADLHYDNVLCVDDKVSGLLDFEFCAFDWRGTFLNINFVTDLFNSIAFQYVKLPSVFRSTLESLMH
jgi:homoserine kinase type II